MSNSEHDISQTISGATAISGAFVTNELTRNLQEATKRVLYDSNELVKVIDQYQKSGVDKVQGRALEFLEVLKFDKEAAEKWRFDLNAKATHFSDPHSPSDINIFKNEELVREIQSKSRGNATQAIMDHSDPKYVGMGRLNPSDKHDSIQNLLHKKIENAPHDEINMSRFNDVAKNLMKSLSFENIKSPGTTRAEAEFAANHPDLVKMFYDGHALVKEVGVSALDGAAISASSAIVFSSLLNAAEIVRGKKDFSVALSDTLACSTSAAVRGGTVAATAQGLKLLTRSASADAARSFSEGAAPIAIANTIFEMGLATRKFVKGDIEINAYKEACGTAAMKGVATYYCGTIG